jgi:hypothetical protein
VLLKEAGEKGFGEQVVDRQTAGSMGRVLRRVRDTDVDNVVRANANDALNVVQDLVRQRLGLMSDVD